MKQPTIQIVYKEKPSGDSALWFKSELSKLAAKRTFKELRFPEKTESDVIITLGKATTELFIDLSLYGSFTNTIGYVFDTKWGTVIPCIHPKDMYTNVGNKLRILKTFDKADNYARGFRDAEEELIIHNSTNKVLEYLRACKKAPEVCIDIETTGKEIDSKLTAVGVSKGPNEAMCFSMDMYKADEAVSLVKEIIEDPKITKIGQNFVNFDSQILGISYGMAMYGNVWDTLDCFKLLYPELKQNAGLGAQGSMFLYCKPWKDEAWKETGRKLREYCAKDVIRTFRIRKAQETELKIQENFTYYKRCILPLGSPVSRALLKGVNFDHNIKEEISQEVCSEHAKLRQKLEEFATPLLQPKKTSKSKRDQANDKPAEIEGFNPPEDFQKLKRAELDALLSPLVGAKEAKEYYIAKKQDNTKFGFEAGKLYKKAYTMDRLYNPGSSSQTLEVFEALGVDEKVISERKPLSAKDAHILVEYLNNHTNFSVTSTKVDTPTRRAKLLSQVSAYANRTRDKDLKKLVSIMTWKPSTGKLALQKAAYKHSDNQTICQFIQWLLDYKPMDKFISGYLNATFPPDGRWHSELHIVGTETNRMASQQYFGQYCGNIQNIPSRNKSSKRFKSCFVPDTGYVFFNFDQAAAETWIQAYLADESNMKDILLNSKDFHSQTARLMFEYNKTDEELKGHDDREIIAKTYNHLSAYDGSDFVVFCMLAGKQRFYSIEEIQNFAKKWHGAYPGIKGKFHKEVLDKILNGEPLVNPLGRRRYFQDVINERMYKQAYADIPQSTVPAVSNLMWLWVDQNYKDEEAMVLFQTHDSVTGQVREDIAEDFVKRFIEAGKQIVLTVNGESFSIPWDGGLGKNYLEA